MIDWINLAFHALWILGCAVALAALSYASWEASLLGSSLRSRFKEPRYLRPFYLSGFLIGVGAGGAASLWWQKLAWFLLAGLFLIQALAALRPERS